MTSILVVTSIHPSHNHHIQVGASSKRLLRWYACTHDAAAGAGLHALELAGPWLGNSATCETHLQGLLLLAARGGHQQLAVGLDLLRGGRGPPPRLRRRPHLWQRGHVSAHTTAACAPASTASLEVCLTLRMRLRLARRATGISTARSWG